jgi:hypothetical protein
LSLPHPVTTTGISVANTGHTYVDFAPLGGQRITKKAKQLAFFAKQRGGIHYPSV